MKKKVNKLIAIFLCSTFFLLFFISDKMKFTYIEALDIYTGAGYSIKKVGKDIVQYAIPLMSNEYIEEAKMKSNVKTGRGVTLGQTRSERQKKIGKKFFFGLMNLYLVDEEYAKYGIKSILDILFKNPIINDKGNFIICSGNSENIYKFKQQGYQNNSEYISEMIENLNMYNFFGKNYTLKNAVLNMDSEGKNIAAPYLKVTESGFKIDGTAILKKDKLALVLNMDESKIMNILREDKSTGILSIQKNPEEYIEYYAQVKRKAECIKSNDKYTFIINLNIRGDVMNNLLYKDMNSKLTVVKKFEKDMENHIEKSCNEFIEKMQKEYKTDCLQLGWVAAAKYGRDTGVDWNEIVSKADIKVNVKVRVDNLGRGKI